MAAVKALSFLLRLILCPLFLIALIIVAPLSRLTRRRDPADLRLVWGTFPILNYKYWSAAMREGGWQSETVTSPVLSINAESDFDRLLYGPRGNGLVANAKAYPRWLVANYVELLRALLRYDVFHHTFDGGFLAESVLWRLEGYIYKLAGIRSVVIPVGGDAYLYSQVIDRSLRHGLIGLGYQSSIKREKKLSRRIHYWRGHADVIVCWLINDGMGRWDALPVSPLAIDTNRWQPRAKYNSNDGFSGPVTVVHTPNHRSFKGTEYLISAVETLRGEGLDLELKLIEGLPNDEVWRVLHEEADILAEQFLFTGYALSGLEGMASGLPVMANLDSEIYTRAFRRFSYLNECPVLSTTPEQLVDNLRILVTDSELRASLGVAGRRYVEKYHSYRAAEFLFGSIYRHFAGEDVDLLNLYHPLLGQTDLLGPRIEHPLHENRLLGGRNST